MEIPPADIAYTTREEVLARWTDLAQGRCSRLQAARWAEDRLEDQAAGEEELVTQALLFLQGVDLIHDRTHGEPGLRHAHVEQTPFITSDLEVANALEAWTQELQRHDLDPDAWNRAYFARMVAEFAARHGAGRAWHFTDKLISSGRLQVTDVEEVLGRRPPAPERADRSV